MTFLLVYLYVNYLIFLPVVMHMHIKLMNTLGNWLINTYARGEMILTVQLKLTDVHATGLRLTFLH